MTGGRRQLTSGGKRKAHRGQRPMNVSEDRHKLAHRRSSEEVSAGLARRTRSGVYPAVPGATTTGPPDPKTSRAIATGRAVQVW